MLISELRRGAAVWVDHFGEHPAVVLDVYEDKLLVICGTTKERPGEQQVLVRPRSPAAIALGLSAPTYFRKSGIAVIVLEKVTRSSGKRCPPNVFHSLEELAEIAASDPTPQEPVSKKPT